MKDGNIITAKLTAYVDLALEIGKVFNIYEDEKQFAEMKRYFKG